MLTNVHSLQVYLPYYSLKLQQLGNHVLCMMLPNILQNRTKASENCLKLYYYLTSITRNALTDSLQGIIPVGPLRSHASQASEQVKQQKKTKMQFLI